MGFVFQHVLRVVTERMGAAPDAVVVTHPATYTNYRLDLLRDAVSRAGIANVAFLPEPHAAALHYASLGRVPEGAAIAVYDLGGGTFDAAVLRRTGDSFEMIGEAKGLERLGGIDFDAAVLDHVDSRLGEQLGSVPDDASARAGLARLRADSRHAKEMLSSDTETTIPVIVPGVVGNVTLTRRELESVLRPRIRESVGVLKAAIASADLQPSELHGVLLVGGSSRIPLVRVVLHAEFDVTITADVDPEMAVAFGAAQHAATMPAPAPRPLAPPIMAPPPVPTPTMAPPPKGPERTSTAPVPTSVDLELSNDVVRNVAIAEPAAEADPSARVAGTPQRRRVLTGALVVLALAIAGFLVFRSDDTPRSGLSDPDCSQTVDVAGLVRPRAEEPQPPCDLSGLDLRSRVLPDVFLQNANLDRTKLSGADMSDFDCVTCSFRDADLSGAKLGNATLRDADFTGATLIGADLSGVNLGTANITDAVIYDATELGTVTGGLLFVNASGQVGVASLAVTKAESHGYVSTPVGSTDAVVPQTAIACQGNQRESDVTKLALLIGLLTGVFPDRTDFDEIVSLTQGDLAPGAISAGCIAVLGADFVIVS